MWIWTLNSKSYTNLGVKGCHCTNILLIDTSQKKCLQTSILTVNFLVMFTNINFISRKLDSFFFLIKNNDKNNFVIANRRCTRSFPYKNDIWPLWEHWVQQRRIRSGRWSLGSEQRSVGVFHFKHNFTLFSSWT